MHPILIVIPLGLFSTTVAFDVLNLITGQTGFATISGYLIAAGLLMGLTTAAIGWLDWWLVASPGSRARRIGLYHGVVNSAVLVLFAISGLLRTGQSDWQPTTLSLITAWAGVVVGGLGGWIGGELVERAGTNVHERAPSSWGAVARS